MKYPLLFFFILQGIFNSFGQDLLSNKIIETSINSTVLNEERKILIFSSLNKEKSESNLPTIFLLDGRENFFLVAGIISNLIKAELIPDVNLVGIITYDYDREYNLTTKSNSDDIYFDSGGSSDFQKFIIDELFPFTDSTVSTSNYKILIGHSIGGFFGLNMLMENPNSFSSAIFADPSIWWNNSELIDSLQNNKSVLMEIPIYLSRSQKEKENNVLFDSLEHLIESKHVMFERFPNENHISMLVPSIFGGLKYIFKNFSFLESLYEEANFMVIKEKIQLLSIYYDTRIPPKVRAMAPKARKLTNEGKYLESIKILKYLEEYHPEDIMVLNFLGEAFEKSGDLKNAELIYNRSLKIAKSKKSPMVRWIEKRLAIIENK